MFKLTEKETLKVKESINKIQYLNTDYFKDTFEENEEESSEHLRKVKNSLTAVEILLQYVDFEEETLEEIYSKISDI